jgi:hypothetical protein
MHHAYMVGPANDNLGPGEEGPHDAEAPKLPKAPRKEPAPQKKGKWEDLSDDEFDRAIHALFDFSKEDPWEQEKAPPVNQDAVRRWVLWYFDFDKSQMSDEEGSRIRKLTSGWENWHKAAVAETNTPEIRELMRRRATLGLPPGPEPLR